MKSRIFAAGIALLATACAEGGIGSGVIVRNAHYEGYSRSDYVYASAGGFPVDVRGNPLSVPQEVFDGAVVEAMQGTTWGPPAHFVVQPEGPQPLSRIVLEFGDSRNVNTRALCTTEARGDGRFEGRPVVVGAAFCHGERPLSRVIGSVPDLSGPRDTRLHSLMSQVISQLLPPENPHFRDGCRFGFGC